MDVYTIGFTQTTAERFFARLKDAGVRRVLDVRLYNTSQLAGFAKARDLPYFVRELLGADYEHDLRLAPTPQLFFDYKRRGGAWSVYERGFLALMAQRQIERALSPAQFRTPTALLCTEPTAERCHRRLVCQHLAEHWSHLRAVHL
ncbi:MAG TPA: DUF488 domain-containing protein [Solirubrobacteraceae bacterium]|nr:DUF488 domain-containing protein [Solirubrobacteraceae bacterium]